MPLVLPPLSHRAMAAYEATNLCPWSLFGSVGQLWQALYLFRCCSFSGSSWSCSGPLHVCPSGAEDTHKCLCLGPSLLNGLCPSGFPGLLPTLVFWVAALVRLRASPTMQTSPNPQRLPPTLPSYQAQLHLSDPRHPPESLPWGHHPYHTPNPHQTVPSGSQISVRLRSFPWFCTILGLSFPHL